MPTIVCLKVYLSRSISSFALKFLVQRPGKLCSAAEIANAIPDSSEHKKSRFLKDMVNHSLNRYYDLGIVDKGGRDYTRIRILPKGMKLAKELVNPVLEAIIGNTSSLVMPTKKEVYDALVNYERNQNYK